MVMLRACWLLCGGVAESVTLAVKGKGPVAVGVPVMAPLDAFNCKPPGKAPEMTVQVNGLVPPATCKVAEYAGPAWPPARVVVLTVGAATTVTVAVADFVVSPTDVAVTVTVAGLGTAGGAVYLPVASTEPQAAPVQPAPDTLQVTPLLPVSF